MRFAVVQPEPCSGDLRGNAEALLAAIPSEASVAFAPEGAIEGPSGAAALALPWQRARYESILRDMCQSLILSEQKLLVPVATAKGVRPALLGAGENPVFETDHGRFDGDAFTVSVRPEEEADIFWRWRGSHTPWKTLPFGVAHRAQAMAATSLAGAEGTAVFRGESFLVSGEGGRKARAFGADVLCLHWPLRAAELAHASGEAPLEAVRYDALVTGIRRYVERSGLSGAVIGLSGGVDSALDAAAAVDALGAGRVTGIFLPSRYSSEESRSLVRELTRNLGLPFIERPISDMHQAVLRSVEPDVGVLETGDIADQNIQARMRAVHLMTLANKRNGLLLCNGNKGECAMGYGTMYGDLAGGLTPIGDLWKSEVRALCREKNRRSGREVIPEAIIGREPTAELRPGQRDVDSIPPYDEIERVMRAVMEEGVSPQSLSPGDRAIVKYAKGMAFKRAQAPAVLRLSEVTLGDWDALWGGVKL